LFPLTVTTETPGPWMVVSALSVKLNGPLVRVIV
jgi:hypothetical protein